jgi:exodeoxyribonuclease V beta subunit
MRNIALKSSAGSGKTYELAKRFLSLYLKGFPLESLYGITFTNKAALEMKERIIHYLDILVNNNPMKPDEIEIVREFGERQKYAHPKRGYLFNNLSSLNISTFHSLFASFLSTLPFEAGILPGYEIIDEAGEAIMLDEVLDRFFEKALKKKEYKKAILDLVQNKEERVKGYISRIFIDTRKDIGLIRETLGDLDRIERSLKTEEAEFKRVVDRFLLFMEENRACAYTNKGSMDVLMDGFIQKVKRLTEDKDWIKIGKKLISDDFLSKKYFRRFIDKLSDRKEQFNEIVDCLTKKLKLLLISLSDGELNIHMRPICEIDRMLQEEKLRRNFITFDDIEKLAERALKSGTDYLYFKIGAKIDHLMIDEFQDTSIRQWEILKPLVDEITSYGAEEKTLFYVGDPNQAVFRWRGGEVRLFDFVESEYESKIKENTLDINHRSKSAIVDFVNTLYKRNDIYEENNRGGWVCFESVGSFKAEEGREETRRRTVEVIRELRDAGYDYEDIAVLVRGNKYGVAITDLLESKGIPCISESKANVFSKDDTRTVINLLKFLERPEDDFSLLQVLLSPFFSIEENTLKKIKDKGKSDRSLYLSLIDEHPNWDTSEKLKKLLSMVGFSSPYKVVYRIYEELNLPMTGSLAALLEAAFSYTEEESGPLSSFIDWIELIGEDIEVEETEGRGVRILTVHKAKGLEFPVVIIPDTVWKLQEENKLLLYHYEEGGIKPDKVYWASLGKFFPEVVRASTERVKEDEKKVLYVALTRAIEGIYILGFDWGNRFTWFDFIREEIGCPYKVGEIKKMGRGKGKREERRRRRVKGREKKVRAVREERELYSPTEKEVEVVTVERREKMEFGDIVHRALSKVEWIDGRNIEELTSDLLEYVKSVYVRRVDDEKLIEDKVKGVLYDTLAFPDFQFAFNRGKRDVKLRVEIPVYFEKEKKDVSIRIDRLLIEPQRITIIDYKTGEEKDEDIKQIRLYKEGMKKIFPEKEVGAYLLYVEKKLVKEVK